MKIVKRSLYCDYAHNDQRTICRPKTIPAHALIYVPCTSAQREKANSVETLISGILEPCIAILYDGGLKSASEAKVR